jgi:acetylornithine deacetylase/succinyl-diaminopimelate desuccinylase-like protein
MPRNETAGGEAPAPAEPTPVPAELLDAATDIVHAMWGPVPVYPMMSQWATDGAYLRAAGIPTYGVQGFFYDRDDIRFHGRDERLAVRSFYEGQTFLYELVKRLAGAPAA